MRHSPEFSYICFGTWRVLLTTFFWCFVLFFKKVVRRKLWGGQWAWWLKSVVQTVRWTWEDEVGVCDWLHRVYHDEQILRQDFSVGGKWHNVISVIGGAVLKIEKCVLCQGQVSRFRLHRDWEWPLRVHEASPVSLPFVFTPLHGAAGASLSYILMSLPPVLTIPSLLGSSSATFVFSPWFPIYSPFVVFLEFSPQA